MTTLNSRPTKRHRILFSSRRFQLTNNHYVPTTRRPHSDTLGPRSNMRHIINNNKRVISIVLRRTTTSIFRFDRYQTKISPTNRPNSPYTIANRTRRIPSGTFPTSRRRERILLHRIPTRARISTTRRRPLDLQVLANPSPTLTRYQRQQQRLQFGMLLIMTMRIHQAKIRIRRRRAQIKLRYPRSITNNRNQISRSPILRPRQ